MYEKIVEQLKNYCSCIKESDLEADKLEKNVGELIDLISTITCWKNHPCETFLSSQREEVFDVGEFKKCGCDSGMVRIPLFYPMIDPTTIEVSVITRERITFTTHKLEVDKDFSYNPYDSIVYVDLSNIDYKDVCNCGCDELSKIVVSYVAGYETIPECLLPVFCDFLQFVIAMNRCECGCSTCEETDGSDVLISEENSDAQISISVYVREHITKAYSEQLGILSVCNSKDTWVGAVV